MVELCGLMWFMRRVIRRFFAFLGVLCFTALLALSYQIFIWMVVPYQIKAEPIVFEVQKGQSTHQIAKNLFEQGLIYRPEVFKLYSQWTGQSGQIRAGEYRLSASMRMSEILSTITEGKGISYPITFPEGINLYEIADILESKQIVKKVDFFKASRDQDLIQKLLGQKLLSFEGYFFPETYHFEKQTEASVVIETMVQRFLSVYRDVMSIDGASSHLNRHDIVRLASIVEKETGLATERPRIASVFLNRLQKNMRLQSDPTIIYGILAKTGVLIKNIKKKDITTKNPYNTYVIKGLPLEPIANPGRLAIHAVVFPEKTDDLYFVSRNDGSHYFSKTYTEHKEAVRKFQLSSK